MASQPAVLLGGDATAVPVARSLGRAGVPVHAVGGPSEPARRSRYVVEFADIGAGDGLQERALEWLTTRAPSGAVVLPCSDEGLELVARNRALLEASDLVPIEADDAKLLDMLDKERTHELATAHGIPVPPTATVHDAAELRQAVEEIGFPCALKPLHAHEFRRHFEGKGFVASGWSDLEEFFRLSEEAGVAMLVTQMVHGPDRYHSSYTYLDEGGEPLFTFTKQKLRQYPVTFGAGVFHTMDWNEEVSDLGLRFCTSVGLRGLLNVEFKRDARDGQLMLIECNHRFTASSALHVAAGLDVPLFVYNRLTGRPTPHVGRPYNEKKTLWYPLDDFRAFKEYRRRGEMTTREYVRSIARRHAFSIASPSDPGPMLVSLKPRFVGLWRRLRRRFGIGEAAPPASPGAPVHDEPRTPAGTPS